MERTEIARAGDEVYQEIMDLNVSSVFDVCRAVPVMRRQGSGTIVNEPQGRSGARRQVGKGEAQTGRLWKTPRPDHVVMTVIRVAGPGVVACTILVAGLLLVQSDQSPQPVDPASVYDPIVAGEHFPGGIRWPISRDGIRPVYNPEFVSADEASWDADDLVIGLAVDGYARAYHVGFLSAREMINDVVGRTPILVSWCPLCASGAVHLRKIDGVPVLFGNQGALWGNAMTWWDHQTGSIWSQPLGKAIAGPLKGLRIELLPSTLTTWSSWREAHPETLALDGPTYQSGLDLDAVVIVVELGDEARAYHIAAVREAGVVNDVVGGVEVGVLVDPSSRRPWAVFSRRLDDVVITLALTGDELTDLETGSVWDPVSGRAVSGVLIGETLRPLPAATMFPKDFPTFWPEGTFWEP